MNCFAGVLPWRLRSKSAVSILCFTCLAMFFTEVQAKPEKLLDDWDVEYLQLQKQIQEGKGLAKSVGNTLDSKILDRHALIWSSDTSPVDVALRRTQALLGHVKTLKDAPDLSYLQKELDEISKKRIHSGLAKVSSDFSQNDTKDFYMARLHRLRRYCRVQLGHLSGSSCTEPKQRQCRPQNQSPMISWLPGDWSSTWVSIGVIQNPLERLQLNGIIPWWNPPTDPSAHPGLQ